MAGEKRTLGFIGLGVMGEPMCRHLTTKSGDEVVVFDLSSEPLQRLKAVGARVDKSAQDVADRSDILFVSLPSGAHLEALCRGDDGVLQRMRPGTIFVDLGTSPLDTSRALAADFAKTGVRYADAPVARTRAAAEQGTLAITVGADDEVFAIIEPLLRCFASEVTHCGGVGAGQIVKILNNMVVVGTVVALSEASAIAEAAGIDTRHLFETFAKASADSFALRNHGLKSIAPGAFPERAFSTDYMFKDMQYALRMASTGGVTAKGAEYGGSLLEQASKAGHGAAYWPIISTLLKT